MHGRLGIDRAVIVNPTVHGTDARVVTDAIARSGGRYRGIVNINDSFDEKQLAALDRQGIRGCRFTFVGHLGGPANLDVLHRAIPKIRPLGWHVDLYLEPRMIPLMAPMLKELPVRYVIDHMGLPNAAEGLDQPNFAALLKLLREDEKAWVKISGPERASRAGPPFADAVPFARALIETAPDRVIWGTDWPHPNVKFMPNDGDLADLITQYAPDPAARQKLLVDNPGPAVRFQLRRAANSGAVAAAMPPHRWPGRSPLRRVRHLFDAGANMTDVNSGSDSDLFRPYGLGDLTLANRDRDGAAHPPSRRARRCSRAGQRHLLPPARERRADHLRGHQHLAARQGQWLDPGHFQRRAGGRLARRDRRAARSRRPYFLPALAHRAHLAPGAATWRPAAGGPLGHPRRGQQLHRAGPAPLCHATPAAHGRDRRHRR